MSPLELQGDCWDHGRLSDQRVHALSGTTVPCMFKRAFKGMAGVVASEGRQTIQSCASTARQPLGT